MADLKSLDVAESDYLRKSRQEAERGRSRDGGGGRLGRTDTLREWAAAADSAPPPPPRSYRGPQPAWPLTDEGFTQMLVSPKQTLLSLFSAGKSGIG